ncbi:hypothetical protein ACFY2M_45470, partial [Streptomyces sp. NPDC001276]|uniref:hypothetical protein n=1 Tax=Streptomyces sp. NPDC001276 TaxID=3364555 RepID=UPI00368AADD3
MPGPRCTVISGTPLAALGFPLSRDDHTAYLSSTTVDRLAKAVKTGNGTGTETYVHDDNANVINQTVQGITTAFNYDRDRLLTATTSGATANYNYDPFGFVAESRVLAQILGSGHGGCSRTFSEAGGQVAWSRKCS